MALTPPPLMPVYNPDGKKEMHTKANARDLVVGAGYSWHPNVPSQPAAFAPFVTLQAPSDRPQSQEVVDKVGGSLAMSQAAGAQAAQAAYQAPLETPDEDEEEAAPAAAPEPAPAPVAEAAPAAAEAAPAAAEEPAAETADEDASDAPSRGRGRRGRGEA